MIIVRNSKSEGAPGKAPIATAFAVLQLLGAIGLAVILGTALLSRNVKRSSIWISLFVGWIISCISYDLLFFAGQQTGADPGFAICLVQGALIHSVPILQVGTVLSLMIHTWLFVRSGVTQQTFTVTQTSLILLLVFPYIITVSVFLGFLIFGLNNPSTVARDSTGVYCNIFFHRVPSQVTAGIGGFMMIVALIFEGFLGRLLYRNWRMISQQIASATMIIRVIVFTIAGVLMLGAAIVYLTVKDTIGFNWVLSSMPIVAILVFGTQRDLLQAWMFWKTTSGLEESKQVQSTSTSNS